MSATTIKSVKARQVYALRGHPGVEAIVTTENGAVGRAICTSGVSIGTHEIAFNFDGGNSATMVYNGGYYQQKSRNNERAQSDMLYFATLAGPEGTP